MTAPTKAIVLHQPHASLVAIGAKTIETRPSPPNGPMRPAGVRGLPGLPIARGERIAIVAGKARPRLVHEWRWGVHDDDTSPLTQANEGPWVWDEWGDGYGGSWRWWSGPLGAVVCTAVVADALPMVPCPPYSSSFDDRWQPDPSSVLYLGGLDGGPWAFIDGDGPISMTDQLPFGDFAPGRWGWLLADVEPCDPVPCKGRQGVYRLAPETVEALS